MQKGDQATDDVSSETSFDVRSSFFSLLFVLLPRYESRLIFFVCSQTTVTVTESLAELILDKQGGINFAALTEDCELRRLSSSRFCCSSNVTILISLSLDFGRDFQTLSPTTIQSSETKPSSTSSRKRSAERSSTLSLSWRKEGLLRC